jgi:hypothetical protein
VSTYATSTFYTGLMRLTLSEAQLQKQIRYFGYYQLANSFIAILCICWTLAQVESLSGLLPLLYIGFFGLAGFVGYCGYATLKQPPRGLQLARVSLAIQFLWFAVGGFSFQFFVGPYLALGLHFTNEVLFKLNFNLAGLSFYFSNNSTDLLLSVNVVAMLLFFRTTLWLNEWHARYSTSELTSSF